VRHCCILTRICDHVGQAPVAMITRHIRSQIVGRDFGVQLDRDQFLIIARGYQRRPQEFSLRATCLARCQLAPISDPTTRAVRRS